MSDDLTRFIRQTQRRLGRTAAKAPPIYLQGSASPEWTPAFAGTTIAGIFTYAVQVGFYTQIGRLVFIQFNVSISAISATVPTGNMVITGLPLTPAADANSHHGVAFTTISNFNYTNTAFELTGRIPPSDPRIFLFESFDNVAAVNVPAANFTNAACDLRGIGFYMV